MSRADAMSKRHLFSSPLKLTSVHNEHGGTLFYVLCTVAIPVKYQVCTQALMVTAPLLVV